jgi:hypothetical protein
LGKQINCIKKQDGFSGKLKNAGSNSVIIVKDEKLESGNLGDGSFEM